MTSELVCSRLVWTSGQTNSTPATQALVLFSLMTFKVLQVQCIFQDARSLHLAREPLWAVQKMAMVFAYVIDDALESLLDIDINNNRESLAVLLNPYQARFLPC